MFDCLQICTYFANFLAKQEKSGGGGSLPIASRSTSVATGAITISTASYSCIFLNITLHTNTAPTKF